MRLALLAHSSLLERRQEDSWTGSSDDVDAAPLDVQPLREHTLIPPILPLANAQGDLVDLYVPRKCAATGRIIESKDHASVQIAVGDVDENGRLVQGSATTFPLSGYVRKSGESDDSLNRLATKEGCEYACREARDQRSKDDEGARAWVGGGG